MGGKSRKTGQVSRRLIERLTKGSVVKVKSNCGTKKKISDKLPKMI